MSDTPSYLELKQIHAECVHMRDEAFEFRAEADRKLAAADYALGQSEHRRREIADFEKSIVLREARLLNELGEAQLLAREKAAEAKLAEAKELMADYDKQKHAAAININQLIEHDRAELAAAGIEY
jgi:hypothetical protein